MKKYSLIRWCCFLLCTVMIFCMVPAFSKRAAAADRLERPVISVSNEPISGKIVLTWTCNPLASSYKVYRSNTKDGTYTQIATIARCQGSYMDSTAVAGKYYYYKLQACSTDTKLSSRLSAPKGRTCDLPKVQNVTASSTKKGTVTLTWSKAEGATGYIIYRSRDPQSGFTRVKTIRDPNATSWTNTNRVSGRTLYYYVKAVNGNINARSAKSETAVVKVK